jgi:ABC-type thiamine transport system substrate-binding protein
MMDMGFIHALRKIIPLLPEERQTLFFSATLPPKIRKLADQFLTFMTGEAFQTIIPTTNWMYPAYPAGDLPEAFGELVEPSTPLIFAVEDTPEIRKEALAEWLEVLSR